ncbi:NAD(P)-binding protein, partial [Morchella conica CCBAS932]
AIKPLAIIAGVGPGTGASVALRFAREYTVILLSRTASSFDSVVSEIKSNGGEAYGIPTDISNEKSVKDAFAQIKSNHADTPVAAAIFNAAGGFVRKPFLEVTLGEWDGTWAVNGFGRGAFLFSQSTLPLLSASTNLPHPPTLIFTGATASVKSSALFTTFATGKFALRALSQSLAREFGPKGVHISHAVIDGVIDIPRTKEWLTEVPDAKISSNAIADAYWHLHTQPRTAFTWEIDIRPYVEKW